MKGTAPNAKKLLVFVHGIIGDPKSTWMNSTSKKDWPTLVAEDPDFKGYAIYQVQYYTPPFNRSGTLNEIARQVLDDLKSRVFSQEYNEIYFITHSMGGLVTKRALNILNRRSQEGTKDLNRVRAVLFISTPAQGAPIAELAKWLSLNPQLKDMQPSDLNSFLQSLEEDWQDLLRDRKIFPRIFCAYEIQPTYGLAIVSRVYASTLCDENATGFNYDHIHIVKPYDTGDRIYLWGKRHILETSKLPAQWTSSFLSEEDHDRYERAISFGRDRQYSRSLSLLEPLVAKYPEAHSIRYAYGTALSRIPQRRSEAVDHLRIAVKLNPDDASSHHNLGYTLKLLGRTQEAKGELEKAVSLEPNHTSALFVLAHLAYKEGNFTEAIEYYQRIENNGKDSVADAQIYQAYTFLKMDRKNVDKASSLVIKALAAVTDEHEAEAHIQTLCIDAGDRQDPAWHLRPFLRKDLTRLYPNYGKYVKVHCSRIL